MSRTTTFAVSVSSLIAAAILVGGLRRFAQERPPIKSPSPVRPLPPAKPNDPLKPQEPAKPRTPPKEGSAAGPGSMPDKATRAVLAKKVSLDFADAPLNDVIASLAKQTQLEIETATKDATTAGQSDSDSKLTIHVSGIAASSASISWPMILAGIGSPKIAPCYRPTTSCRSSRRFTTSAISCSLIRAAATRRRSILTIRR